MTESFNHIFTSNDYQVWVPYKWNETVRKYVDSKGGEITPELLQNKTDDNRNLKQCIVAILNETNIFYKAKDCESRRPVVCFLPRIYPYMFRGHCDLNFKNTLFFLTSSGFIGSKGKIIKFNGNSITGDGKSLVLEDDKVNTLLATAFPGSLGLKNWTILTNKSSCVGTSKSIEMSFSSCGEDEFVCREGTCISFEKRCDGAKDCKHSYDEEDCNVVILGPTYRKDIVPWVSEDRLDVQFSIAVSTILDIDENKQMFTVKYNIELEWRDYRLDYMHLRNNSNMNMVNIETMKMVWIPNIVHQNTETNRGLDVDESAFMTVKKETQSFMFNNLQTDKTYKGRYNSLTFSRSYTTTFICQFHLQWYPFDTQTCTMEFVFGRNEYLFLEFVPKHVAYLGPKDLSDHFIKTQFLVQGYEMKLISEDSRDWLEIKFTLNRRLDNIVVTKFLPTLILNVIGFGVKYLGDDHFDTIISVNLTVLLVLATM